jgi:[ribosomal protein S5]-alanine N-acetyltransferase
LNGSVVSARLRIEPLFAEHAECMFEPLQDPRIYRWLSSTPSPSMEALRQRWSPLESRLSRDGTGAELAWIVWDSLSGSPVGKMDAAVNSNNIATNLGYLFFPPYWAQGFATEAVIALSNRLVELGVYEQHATVTVGNEASCRVLEKAGFKKTGILPANDVIRGVDHDDFTYMRPAYRGYDAAAR